MHLMIDLETTGTRAGCAVSEIAAVAFEPSLGATRAANSAFVYHRYISLASCHELGLLDDPDTMAWRKQHLPPTPADAEILPLRVALDSFSFFVKMVREQVAGGSFTLVWSKGASFDFPILEAACRAAEMPFPFAYWQCTCIRGWLKMARLRADSSHNALEDCRYQVHALVTAFEMLGVAV